MSISVFVLIIIAAMIVLTLIAVVYFLIYTSNINSALVKRERKHLHMIPPRLVVIAWSLFFVIGIIVLSIIYLPGVGRITNAHDIELIATTEKAMNLTLTVLLSLSYRVVDLMFLTATVIWLIWNRTGGTNLEKLINWNAWKFPAVLSKVQERKPY